MWDENGLESLINVSVADADLLVTILKGDPVSHQYNVLFTWLIRATLNKHRQYKIYEFDSSLIEKEIVDMFDIRSQIIIDEIRQTGRCIYDRERGKD